MTVYSKYRESRYAGLILRGRIRLSRSISVRRFSTGGWIEICGSSVRGEVIKNENISYEGALASLCSAERAAPEED